MRLKLDENLSRHLKPALEALSHDVTTAAEDGLLAKPDEQVAAAAAAESRVLLTLDLGIADVRRFPPGTHPGIVLFRPPTLGPLTVNQFVASCVAATDLNALAGCLVVVEPDRVRIRTPK
jgi:predicted nuclease of predicted toxin-antitoxin system